jgi:chitin disaccharide deacetylase
MITTRNTMQKHEADRSPGGGSPLNAPEFDSPRHVSEPYPGGRGAELGHGYLIINADDWGMDRETTDRSLDCIRRGTVSAVSAMVFMEDSARAAEESLELGVDTGLHLNLSAPFTSSTCPAPLREHHDRVAARLRRHALSRLFYYPSLVRSFEYVVAAQFDEFRRLYHNEPQRIDGHHHLHLCANVQRACLLPAGTWVRPNFSFQPGEKSLLNRLYRKRLDRRLARRHRLVDFLFSLLPFDAVERMQRIFNLSREFVVELETHPAVPEEYRFLVGDTILSELESVGIASHGSRPWEKRAGTVLPAGGGA